MYGIVFFVEMLTEKQRRVLEFIEKFQARFERAPSYEEIRKHFDFKTRSTVQDYIKALKEKGYIHTSERKWNNIELSHDPTSIPLLGKVAAGEPIQYLKFDEKISIPQDMLKARGEYFALQVMGDSMINEGILEDDYVIIQKQETADNGQIVVALIDNEATIKHFYKKKTHIELHSANAKYRPIVVKPPMEFKIAGIFRGLIRKAS